jgi:hypothetical protein
MVNNYIGHHQMRKWMLLAGQYKGKYTKSVLSTGLKGYTMLKAEKMNLNYRLQKSSAIPLWHAGHDVINFRTRGKKFISNNDSCIFIIKKI